MILTQPVNMLQKNWLYSDHPPGRLSVQSAEGDDYRGMLHYLVAAAGISQRDFCLSPHQHVFYWHLLLQCIQAEFIFL
jgi:hypothetical protein